MPTVDASTPNDESYTQLLNIKLDGVNSPYLQDNIKPRLTVFTRFEALRSMLACLENTTTLEASPDNIIPHVPSLLSDAEGNHCSSFPAVLLQLLQAGTRLSHPSCPTSLQIKQSKLFLLVCAARSFDPLTWAAELQPRSPSADL